MKLMSKAIEEDIGRFFKEDDLDRNLVYLSNLPDYPVESFLHIKSDLFLSGAPWFKEVFSFLGLSHFAEELEDHEGQLIEAGSILELGELPFSIALTGERLALNLLQKASSISTYTMKFVEKAEKFNITILDTRKTTPGLRALEKYAVTKGGGFNHRLGQTDMWMVKDNHKEFFGGVQKAVQFFWDQQSFYTPILVEVHSMEEIKEATNIGIKHLMLDNFSPAAVLEAIREKQEGVTYEISGGINLENIDSYLMEGIDAISIGSLTYGAPPVDLSFKYSRL